MRILVATGAWRPQVNGVVTTYERLAVEVERLGSSLAVLSPADYPRTPCPSYPEIDLAWPVRETTAARIRDMAPDAIHIATEGPIGWSVRRWCLDHHAAFTTSFHTMFPEYIRERFAIPTALTYAVLRRFHNAGAGMMVATPSLAADLTKRGFRNILPWTRGVDLARFHPRPVRMFGEAPVLLYVGRVAIEKNITDFLDLDHPGRKVVVGEGPQRSSFAARYPHVLFTGYKSGDELAEAYASADVFVFPSRTDTFGIVQIEAMASGVPIAAYPVTGPIDIVEDGLTGALAPSLREAVVRALALPREPIAARSQRFSWSRTARMFLDHVAAVRRRRDRRAVSLATAPSRG